MKSISYALSLHFRVRFDRVRSTATPTAIPTVVLSANPAATSNTVSASGQVVPAQHVQLSFPLTGVAKTVEVKEGDMVKAGQTLATLDPPVQEAQVREDEADVAKAQTQVDHLEACGNDIAGGS